MISRKNRTITAAMTAMMAQMLLSSSLAARSQDMENLPRRVAAIRREAFSQGSIAHGPDCQARLSLACHARASALPASCRPRCEDQHQGGLVHALKIPPQALLVAAGRFAPRFGLNRRLKGGRKLGEP